MAYQEDILKILESGIQAPSGENSQPWFFKIMEQSVSVFNDPTKDTSLYNYQQKSNLVTHGCLLENISIAADTLGYSARIQLFPDQDDRNLIATIIFDKKAEHGDNELFEAIKQRATNRKPYKKISLQDAHRKEIIDSASSVEGVRMALIEDPQILKRLAEVGAVNEKIVFENRELHSFLFQHLTWTKDADKQNPGFFIDTLEVPPPIKALFKLFRFWKFMNLLNYIGFANLIKKGNEQTYQAASAMGIITAAEKRDEDYIQIGRALQRIWLSATKLGLSFQPLTGVLFFMQALENGASDHFNDRHISEIKNKYQTVRKIFEVHEKNMPIMFRIGYGDAPSARTLRHPIHKFII